MTPLSSRAFAERFRVALAHLNAGELAAAAAACTVLQRAAPDDPAVLQLQATIALRDGRPADALRGICQSLKARPGHVPSLIVAAQAARASGALDQAVPLLRQAVAVVPDLPEPAFLLCQTLLEHGDPTFDAALQGAAARFPAQAREWLQLGVALQQAQRPGAALAAFARAAAADPTLVRAQVGCGLLLREAGRMPEAQAALQRAVALDPTASGAWFALGLTCQDLSDEAGAAAAYAAALLAREDFAEAAVNLGIARQRLGEMEAALAAYRRAIRIRPDTFGRIAQAMTTASTGMLLLDLGALRRLLGA